jgi:hypothetical protein
MVFGFGVIAMKRRAVITLLGCAACAALAMSSKYRALAIDPVQHNEIDGRGYKLWFIGGMRDAIMIGRREATLDLRTLKEQSHLYGVGPIEGLTGEVTIADSRPSLARVGPDHRVHVTENFEAGAPFFVGAEVPAWRDVPHVPPARQAKPRSFGQRDSGADRVDRLGSAVVPVSRL